MRHLSACGPHSLRNCSLHGPAHTDARCRPPPACSTILSRRARSTRSNTGTTSFRPVLSIRPLQSSPGPCRAARRLPPHQRHSLSHFRAAWAAGGLPPFFSDDKYGCTLRCSNLSKSGKYSNCSYCMTSSRQSGRFPCL